MTQNSDLSKVVCELQTLTEHLFSFYELNAEVAISITSDNSIEIAVADSDLTAVFLAGDAVALHAMQGIIVAIAKTHWPAMNLIIHLDVGGFRARQKAELIERIKDLAEQVLRTQSELEVPSLNSLERLIVHKFIAEKYAGSLKTESRGEDKSRTLFIKHL